LPDRNRVESGSFIYTLSEKFICALAFLNHAHGYAALSHSQVFRYFSVCQAHTQGKVQNRGTASSEFPLTVV